MQLCGRLDGREVCVCVCMCEEELGEMVGDGGSRKCCRDWWRYGDAATAAQHMQSVTVPIITLNTEQRSFPL